MVPMLRAIAAMACLALALCGCAHGAGALANGFAFDRLASVYIPLSGAGLFVRHFGAAVVIAPGVAVTNAHNANLVDRDAILGRAPGEDLLFFRTAKTQALPQAAAFTGEPVIAYGQGSDGGLRVARGTVHRLGPIAFTYRADAGKGFSGGPVVDAASGALLGITYGFLDVTEKGRRMRLLIAYSAGFAQASLAHLRQSAAIQKTE